MRKTQKDERRASKAAIVTILTMAQKTLTQFAADIGEDFSTVRQWVMRDNRKVPEEYRRRIAAAYGAVWDDNGEVFQAGSGMKGKFTYKFFNDWRAVLISRWEDRAGFPQNTPYLTVKPNGEPYGKYALEGFLIAKAADTLSRTLHAAENRRGQDNYRRLFAVIESFLHWQENIALDFNLSGAREIQDFRTVSKHGRIESTGQKKFISMMRTVTAPPARSESDAKRWNGRP